VAVKTDVGCRVNNREIEIPRSTSTDVYTVCGQMWIRYIPG